MPVLTIKTADGDRHVAFSPGRSLREVLDSTSHRVRSGCRGMGACGLCRVQTTAEGLDLPTLAERLYLSPDQLASGVRLACQVKPKGNLEVTVLNPAPLSRWKTTDHCRQSRMHLMMLSADPPPCQSTDVGRPYGVAVDLGTTHISLSLFDLLTGEWITGRHGLNPQAEYGADVITRLMAACESRELARALQLHAVDAVGDALADIATREGIGPEQVVKVVLGGNTAMLALLSGRNYQQLLRPAHWVGGIDCLPDNTAEYSRSWRIHSDAVIDILPPLAGFVGSDLVAGVMATRLTSSGPGSLLIDFGTNSEVALWDGKTLWVTSAAGGPAFEGSGISCGMPAEAGAIYQVRLHESRNCVKNRDPHTPGSGDDPELEIADSICVAPGLILDFSTIDGENPAGLCGSGIVDLIACLVRSGKLTPVGRFSPDLPQSGLTLLNGDRQLVLTKKDVDAFQRAKGAVSAAIMVLLSKAGMSCAELRQIFIGGAFGGFLNKVHAVDIGLLPDVTDASIHLCGNTALAGCEGALVSRDSRDCLKTVAAGARVVNLSEEAGFADCFLDGLYLSRWRQ